MRTALVLAGIATLSLSYSSVLAQAPTQSEQDILRELRAIHIILMEVKKDIAKLKKEKKKSDEKDVTLSAFGRFQARKGDQAKLLKIKLPEHPTEDQIQDYIQDIMTASRGQNTFSNSDLQVQMLLKIGPKHLNLLIDAIVQPHDINSYSGNYHVKQAILKLAKEEHKKLILKFLPRITFLARVVSDKGWEKDAKEILLNELASPIKHLPLEWIQAVANLRDPKTYADLKWHLIHRDNRYHTFQVIRDLPDIDLSEAVAKAWEKTGHREWEERGIAKIAIQYGHVNALEYLVDFLGNEDQNKWEISEIRKIVTRHLSFYGSNREIAKWLKKNTDKLVFDKKTKRFIVLPAGKTPNP